MTEQELKQKKFSLISLGCDKNRVDSERLMNLLVCYGLQFTQNLEEAEIVIVNTCAFIKSAKEESIKTILEVAQLKLNNLEKLIVCGCLTQRYYEVLKTEMPEVDAFVRLKNNSKIVEILFGLYGVNVLKYKNKSTKLGRILSTPKNYAYLKIADGCNNCCAYCTIPQIRGRYSSVPMEQLVKEAKEIVKNGVTEIILVAQDVTAYGKDIYGQLMLPKLIQKITKIKKLKWLRLHYCYPNLITDELLQEIDTNNKVCKYLDIPMQHASDDILKLMNRKDTLNSYETVLTKIRNLKNFISIRSTFIVGFPNETKKDFEQLKTFLNKWKLNNVGFFSYSKEEHTRAFSMPHQVPERVKCQRLNEVQNIQQNILINNQEKFVGTECVAVAERVETLEDGNQYIILRNEYNSPNVDTFIAVKNNSLIKLGEYYKVKIKGLFGLDLEGEIL